MEADDDILNGILLDYVEAVQRGERPNRQRLLDSNPTYIEPLLKFFETRDRLDRIAAPLRAAARNGYGWERGADAEATESHRIDGVQTAVSPVEPLGRVGDFLLLREVGRGGMGVVYEAEQISLRRQVAVKILPLAAAIDPRHLQRFRNEAQAAAQLHHSNIVPVHAVGAEGGVHYFAMQYIVGPSLAQLVSELRSGLDLNSPATAIATEHTSRRRDYIRRAAELVRQAADALDCEH